MRKFLALAIFSLLICCKSPDKEEQQQVKLVTLDPGHFHAALVQKTMYDNVDSTVHVYAPESPDLQAHLARIDAYNNRPESPTHWQEDVYTGPDFFEKMIAEKKGNVVVLSGNNQKKAEYILGSLQNGFHVLADKPMAIDTAGFQHLREAFSVAAKNNLLLYDIMTERFEITSILMRELAIMPEIFGSLQEGATDDPAVVKSSVHYFYKFVSGSVLTRPQWFFDIAQQGAGIADVMTHLVDLVQWECFPEQALDYTNDVQIDAARRWPTTLSLSQFTTLTKADSFPGYLQNARSGDTMLNVFSNGEINYKLRGVHVKTAVTWNYSAPEGSGDQYSALMKGTKANLEIKQGAEEGYKPTLYIQPIPGADTAVIRTAFENLATKYPGIALEKIANGFRVTIPDHYKEGHEAHFGRVMQNFLQYLAQGNMPAWEVPNMLTKYYITTRASAIAQTGTSINTLASDGLNTNSKQ